MTMWWLRFLVLSLSIIMLSARGIPHPAPGARLKFTVGIHGMVFCKSCKLPGYNATLDVSPIRGATAILRCRVNSTGAISLPVKTNNGGYFLLQTSELTSFTSQKCHMYVLNSPLSRCDVPLYPGYKGSNELNFEKAITYNEGIEYLYSGGIFVFKPKEGVSCP